MGADDDQTRGGLPEHLGEAHHRDGARADDVGQHLSRSNGGQLVNIADKSSAALSGVAFNRACISMTSTIDASSSTRRSQSRGWSALRLNPPPLGSTSRSRWIVLASTPVASVMRLAA